MSESAWRAAYSATILEHRDISLSQLPELASVERGCRVAAQRQLEWQSNSPEAIPAAAYVRPFAVPESWRVRSPSESSPASVSLAYLLMGHRWFAHATISRQLRALWHPSHLFLLHIDSRANETVAANLRQRFGTSHYSNVHIVDDRQRRPIGWGSFSMVELFLSAIATALKANPELDFFINLSDADVALRTNREVVTFLRDFRGRSFVAVKFPEADEMRYRAHAHMRSATWLECEGEGFMLINTTAADFFGATGEERRCCYARSGPIVYAAPGQLNVQRPAPPSGWSFFHGSQWMVLARNAASWLVTDRQAANLARHTRLTYMADETYVQTALLHSPYRSLLINHNLRYIDWPHGYGDPMRYWMSMGRQHVAGPMVLTEELLGAAVTSPGLFARKVDLELEGGRSFMRRWDAWMAAKLLLERARAGGQIVDGSSGESHEGLAGSSNAGRSSTSLDASQLAAARKLMAAFPRQPTIAESLLRSDPTLQTLLPPPTLDELATLRPDEAARRSSPRPVHFGHEDLMEQQQKQEAREVLPDGRASETAFSPWEEENYDERAHDPTPLAEVIFTDGSRCSCPPRCGRKGQGECCPIWEVVGCAPSGMRDDDKLNSHGQ